MCPTYMSEECHFSERLYNLPTSIPGTIIETPSGSTDQGEIHNPNDRSNNNEPFRRGPWEYIEWRNPDCEDRDTLA